MYSQNDEERVILEYFAGKTDGRFVDVGAWSGATFSNVWALMELGWSGVMGAVPAGVCRLDHQHQTICRAAYSVQRGAGCYRRVDAVLRFKRGCGVIAISGPS